MGKRDDVRDGNYDELKWWYTADPRLTRGEAIAVFRNRFGREPETVEEPGEIRLWVLGPITEAESRKGICAF